MKFAKDLTAGEGFVIFILSLAVFAAAKTLWASFPFDMTAVTLAGAFSAMAVQRYFKNKSDNETNVTKLMMTNGKEPNA
jgi:hypothetical protein